MSFRGAREVPIALVCPPPRGARKFRGPLISVLLATLMGPGVCHEHGARFVALRANAGAYGDCWGCSRQGVVPSLKVRVRFWGRRFGCWSPAGPVGSVGVARLGGLSGFPAGGGLRGPHGVNGRPARGEPTAGFRGLSAGGSPFSPWRWRRWRVLGGWPPGPLAGPVGGSFDDELPGVGEQAVHR